MQFPKISASTLIAAACGSAVTLALHWAYGKYFESDVEVEVECESALEMKADQEDSETDSKVEKEKMKEGSNRPKCHAEKDESITQKEGLAHERGTQFSQPVDGGDKKGTQFSEPVDGGNGLVNDNHSLQIADDGLLEASSRGSKEPAEKEDSQTDDSILLVESGVSQKSVDYESKDQGTTAKPETAEKGIVTDENGYCKGDEDITPVDRKLMQMMVNMMMDLENRLIGHGEERDERVSLFQQLFW